MIVDRYCCPLARRDKHARDDLVHSGATGPRDLGGTRCDEASRDQRREMPRIACCIWRGEGGFTRGLARSARNDCSMSPTYRHDASVAAFRAALNPPAFAIKIW